MRCSAASASSPACRAGRRWQRGASWASTTLTYVGNHGLEVLEPGASAPVVDPRPPSWPGAWAPSPPRRCRLRLPRSACTLEDKDAIWALHYRRADHPAAAQAALERVAADAREVGLVPHWGRMVLEIRPPIESGKGAALAACSPAPGRTGRCSAVTTRTDLDAFRALHDLLGRGNLVHAVRVGVRSPEGPPEIVSEADLVVDGPEGFVDLLEQLAR